MKVEERILVRAEPPPPPPFAPVVITLETQEELDQLFGLLQVGKNLTALGWEKSAYHNLFFGVLSKRQVRGNVWYQKILGN